MDVIEGFGAGGTDLSEGLCAVVRENFLDREGGGYLVALVHGAVGDEAVHLGPQGNDFQYRSHHHLKQIVPILRILRIFLRQVGVHIGQVNAL